MQIPRHRPTPDLNVTPLIDVLLVLLVMFMATLADGRLALHRHMDLARGAGISRVGVITDGMRAL